MRVIHPEVITYTVHILYIISFISDCNHVKCQAVVPVSIRVHNIVVVDHKQLAIDGFHGAFYHGNWSITSPCCLLIGQYPHHMTLCPPVAIVKKMLWNSPWEMPLHNRPNVIEGLHYVRSKLYALDIHPKTKTAFVYRDCYHH